MSTQTKKKDDDEKYISPKWSWLAVPGLAALIISDAASSLAGTFGFGTSIASYTGWGALSFGLCVVLPALGTGLNIHRIHMLPIGIAIILSGVLTMKSTEGDFNQNSEKHKHQSELIDSLKSERDMLQESLSPADPYKKSCSELNHCDSKAEKARLREINQQLQNMKPSSDPKAGNISGGFNTLIMVLRAFGVPIIGSALGQILGYIYRNHKEQQEHTPTPTRTPPGGGKSPRTRRNLSEWLSGAPKHTPTSTHTSGLTAESTHTPEASATIPEPTHPGTDNYEKHTYTPKGWGTSTMIRPDSSEYDYSSGYEYPAQQNHTQPNIIVHVPEQPKPEIKVEVPVEINLPEPTQLDEPVPEVAQGPKPRVQVDPAGVDLQRYSELLDKFTNENIKLNILAIKRAVGCGQTAAERLRAMLIDDGYIILNGGGGMVATEKLRALRDHKPQLRAVAGGMS